MPRYKLISDRRQAPVEFDGFDAACVLNIASRKKMEEVDVYQDERYLFSVHHNRSGGGLWTIYQKPAPERCLVPETAH